MNQYTIRITRKRRVIEVQLCCSLRPRLPWTEGIVLKERRAETVKDFGGQRASLCSRGTTNALSLPAKLLSSDALLKVYLENCLQAYAGALTSHGSRSNHVHMYYSDRMDVRILLPRTYSVIVYVIIRRIIRKIIGIFHACACSSSQAFLSRKGLGTRLVNTIL